MLKTNLSRSSQLLFSFFLLLLVGTIVSSINLQHTKIKYHFNSKFCCCSELVIKLIFYFRLDYDSTVKINTKPAATASHLKPNKHIGLKASTGYKYLSRSKFRPLLPLQII